MSVLFVGDDMSPGKTRYEITVSVKLTADTPGEADRIVEMLLEHGRDRADEYMRRRGYASGVFARQTRLADITS